MNRTTFRRSSIAAACLCALLSAPSPAAAQERVIVDSDMGVLNDDAVALFMLLNSPNVEVLGVTIVPGNSWVEKTRFMAAAVRARCVHGSAGGPGRHRYFYRLNRRISAIRPLHNRPGINTDYSVCFCALIATAPGSRRPGRAPGPASARRWRRGPLRPRPRG